MSGKIEFSSEQTWAENFQRLKDENKDRFNNAPSNEKTRIYHELVKNPISWLTDYQRLEGLEDDSVFIYLINALGTTINEAASEILMTKSEEEQSQVDKKIIKLFRSNKATGTYIPVSENINFEFDQEKMSDNYAVKPEINIGTSTLMTFKELIELSNRIVSTVDSKSFIEQGELEVKVDSHFNQMVLIHARDNPAYLMKLTLVPTVAEKVVGNCKLGKDILVELSNLAIELRERYLTEEQRIVSEYTLKGQGLPNSLIRKYEGMSVPDRVAPIPEEDILRLRIDAEKAKAISNLCRIIEPNVGKFLNDKLPQLFHKINVAYICTKVRKYVDFSKPIVRGHILPADICKYLSEYNINDCEKLRTLYSGTLRHINLDFELKDNVNNFNDFELTLFLRSAPGRKMIRFIILILLTTPSEVLRFNLMPQNVRSVFLLLLLLTYQNHHFLIRGLLEEKDIYAGLIKNLFNYLIYWICKGHAELIQPVLKIYTRFERGAMYDTHKQVQNLLDTNSFMLYEQKLEKENQDIFTDSFLVTLSRDLLSQDWYQPTFIKKFTLQISSTDYNSLYTYLGYDKLVTHPLFTSEFKDVKDKPLEYQSILTVDGEIKLTEFRQLLMTVNLDAVRAQFNIIFKRDLSKGVVPISLSAWDKYLSEVTQTYNNFQDLEFIPLNHCVTKKGQGDVVYGVGNYVITEILTDSIKYRISNGIDSHLIDPNLKQTFFNNPDKIRSTAVQNKNQSILDRLKGRYNAYKERMSSNNNAYEQKSNKNDPHNASTTITDDIVNTIISNVDNFPNLFNQPRLKEFISTLGVFNWPLNNISIIALKTSLITRKSEIKNILQEMGEYLKSNEFQLELNNMMKNYDTTTKELEDYKKKVIESEAWKEYNRINNSNITLNEFKTKTEYDSFIKQVEIKYKDKDWTTEYIEFQTNQKRKRDTFDFFRHFKE